MLLDSPSQHTTNGFLVCDGTYNDPIIGRGRLYRHSDLEPESSALPASGDRSPNTHGISPLTGTARPQHAKSSLGQS